jgi:hypothetical protein
VNEQMPDVTRPPVPGAALGNAQAGLRALDLQRFSQEVAGEIGVDPNNLGAYGLNESQMRSYETQLHSGTQRNGSQGGGSR